MKPKEEIVILDDDKESSHRTVVTLEQKSSLLERNSHSRNKNASPFSHDNSFGDSLDNDFDKLFKSKQQLTLHTISSSEQKEFNKENNENVNNSIEVISGTGELQNKDAFIEMSDTNIERSWSRGNIFKGEGDEKMMSPVALYKQPKISDFSFLFLANAVIEEFDPL